MLFINIIFGKCSFRFNSIYTYLNTGIYVYISIRHWTINIQCVTRHVWTRNRITYTIGISNSSGITSNKYNTSSANMVKYRQTYIYIILCIYVFECIDYDDIWKIDCGVRKWKIHSWIIYAFPFMWLSLYTFAAFIIYL